MFKTLGLVVISLFVAMNSSSVEAQQSLQALHTRVPAPPATAAAAPAWLKSAEMVALRKQLKDQRAFVDNLHKTASQQSVASASSGPIDYARMQSDPAYAKQMQEKLQKMTQAEQMAFAMEMQKSMQAQAIQDVKQMAADPEAVTLAAEQYPDYNTNQMTSGGIQAQSEVISGLQRQVSDKAFKIGERVSKQMKCSDGEGSCSAADEAADKATLRAAHAEIIAEYNKVLPQIAQQIAAAKKARAADIANAQKYLAPAQYGSAAQSSANKQLLAAYHNAVLIEIEQLFMLTEDVAKWAAGRVNDRTINFMPLD
jgi:hypothetical protein